MGVPTFYRWLITRYPKIVKSVYESRDSDVYLRRTKIEENGEFFKVHDLGDYVNNTDESHCSDNINGYYDNLYLDMNGIIHLCSHNNNNKSAKSNEEIFLNVFLYVERLFDIIEPKNLLYMAIDGVAPKAKMNQQRSRRFKSILCSEIERKAYIELKEKFIAENRMVPEESSYWDSNVITPGTQFMHELSIALKYFIEHKITNDEKWKKIAVIFSDSNVCGEGEHKIFNFIKSQRAQKGYDPNTRHVIHGMDADLIMLSLASHEPYFYILREIIDLDPKGEEKEKKKEYVGMIKNKEDAYFCSKIINPIKNTHNKYNDPNYANVNLGNTASLNYQNWNELQILDLTILREYLSKDLFFDSSFNMERCIDDFIFICFFCGNDFLPHLPSISIAGGSIDQLILLYQKVLPTLGDYLINEGTLNLKSFFKYVSFIAEVERETFISQYDFKKKREKRELQKDSLKRAKCIEEEQNRNSISSRTNINSDENNCINTNNISSYTKEHNLEQNSLEQPSTEKTISKKMLYESKIQSMQPIRNIRYKDKKGEKSINFLVRPASNFSEQIVNEQTINCSINDTKENIDSGNKIDGNNNSNDIYFKSDKIENNNEYNAKMKTVSNPNENKICNMDYNENKKLDDINEFNLLLKEAIKKANETENPKDDVELGCDENPEVIRIKYYKSKFHLDETDYIDEFVKNVVYKYIEGLAWVLAYYFQSCPMWHWYYPYYYAPLSSDLIIDDISFNFEKDEPLLPFEQLLCVLPSNSSHCLPKIYRHLMLHHESPIIDFYPKTFKEEENGKKYKYQWVILLPFVDKDRIIKHARPLHDLLTDEEKKRNRRGLNKIYMDSTHPLSKQITKSIKKYLKEVKEKGKLEGEKVKDLENNIKKSNEEVDKKQKKKIQNSTYDDFFKNMNIVVPINTKKDVNLFGYLNCKHEDSDVNILKEIFRFSSNFSTTCNSAFYIQPEFKKHTSSLLPNHINPKKVLNVLDINNEERKLRFNAPAAKRMILNSLSANHPQIYSFSKMNNSKSTVINYKYYNSNNYLNENMANNTHNYNKNKEHMYNHHNINSTPYMNTQKNYSYHNQNYQNLNYNENFPACSYKNSNTYKLPKNSYNYMHDNKKDNNYHNYMNQKNSYYKDSGANYESSYKISYNAHNNNYIKNKNEKSFSNNYHNPSINYHNNNNNENYNERNNFRSDSFKNMKNSIGMNKRTTYDSRSVPYKNKEY
ncbi:exoribonuclease, putative [Plasmodium gallinaceum]|uniref:5'-3' exoribonuclease n=1 Tax=Plasmodium gallinaceum TaxID=5849 RepID=A0A1J1GVQ9_PLAGA|nr:exoribonuclease, putative [Plasmodium gallinaceum]CRG96642.1 exoribonuclease, putative [Plasmodium gallinaceum]